MHAVAVTLLLSPTACAARTSAAKTTRFSTALACAFFMRTAHADCGLGSSGYPTASPRPQTAMRSRMYGIHINPVNTETITRYSSSVFIYTSPVDGRLQDKLSDHCTVIPGPSGY